MFYKYMDVWHLGFLWRAVKYKNNFKHEIRNIQKHDDTLRHWSEFEISFDHIFFILSVEYITVGWLPGWERQGNLVMWRALDYRGNVLVK